MNARASRTKLALPTRWLCLLAICLSPGCAALSLFTTTHEHHYDTNPTVERRLDAIEQRLGAVERSVSTPGTATTDPSSRNTSASSTTITE